MVVTPDEPLLLECQHFLQCIQNGSKPKTDGNEGLRVLRVLNASQRSIYQNGGKIDLKKLDTKSKQLSIQQESFIHPAAVIDDGSEVGTGTKI